MAIYKRVINVVFWGTILHVLSVAFSVNGLVFTGTSAEVPNEADPDLLQKPNALIIFKEIYRVIMVVLFTTFAYDSAKRQINRENLTK